MKKHISILIALIIVLSLFWGNIGVAKAAGDSELKISPSPIEVAAEGDVSLTATITNYSGVDLAAGFTIRKGTTQVCATSEINIPSESSDQITFTYHVSESEIGTLIWFAVYDVDGNAVDGMMCSVNILRKELTVGIGVTFSVLPAELVASGDIVTLKFVIENQGEAKLTDISIKIPGINSNKPLNDTTFSVSAGKSKTFEYQYTVSSAATLAPVVTYKASGTGDTLTNNPTPIDLVIENRKVDVTFTVNNPTPNAGEDVTFTADVTNNGNVPYTSVTAYINGEEVGFSSSKLAPGAHYSKDYTLSFVASTDVTFLLKLTDHKGEIVNVEKTVSISLPIDESEIASNLTMTMEVDRPQLTAAGTVTFTGHITNATAYSLTQLVVMETTQNKEAYNNALLSSYGTASFEYEAQVSETTTFNFVLTVIDTDGVTHTINPVPMEIKISSAPVGTDFEDAADVTQSSTADTDTTSGMSVVLVIAIVLIVLIIGVGIALLVLWKHQKSGGSSGRPGGKPNSVKKRPATTAVKRKPVSRGYRDRNSF